MILELLVCVLFGGGLGLWVLRWLLFCIYAVGLWWCLCCWASLRLCWCLFLLGLGFGSVRFGVIDGDCCLFVLVL